MNYEELKKLKKDLSDERYQLHKKIREIVKEMNKLSTIPPNIAERLSRVHLEGIADRWCNDEEAIHSYIEYEYSDMSWEEIMMEVLDFDPENELASLAMAEMLARRDLLGDG